MGVVRSGAKWNEEDTSRERRRWEEGRRFLGKESSPLEPIRELG